MPEMQMDREMVSVYSREKKDEMFREIRMNKQWYGLFIFGAFVGFIAFGFLGAAWLFSCLWFASRQAFRDEFTTLAYLLIWLTLVVILIWVGWFPAGWLGLLHGDDHI